jgi:hypothetical protein
MARVREGLGQTFQNREPRWRLITPTEDARAPPSARTGTGLCGLPEGNWCAASRPHRPPWRMRVLALLAVGTSRRPCTSRRARLQAKRISSLSLRVAWYCNNHVPRAPWWQVDGAAYRLMPKRKGSSRRATEAINARWKRGGGGEQQAGPGDYHELEL